MESVFQFMFDETLANVGYKNNDEYINDEIKAIDVLLVYYNNRLSGEDGKIIKKCAKTEYEIARKHIDSRLEATDKDLFLAGRYFRTIYNLNELEWFFVVTAVAVEAEPGMNKKLLKIDNATKLQYCSVFKLYFFEDDVFDIDNYFTLFSETKEKLRLICFEGEEVKISSSALENITNNTGNVAASRSISVLYPKEGSQLIIREDVAEKTYKFFKSRKNNEVVYFYVYGAHGIGKTYLMKRVCEMLRRAVVCCDLCEVRAGDKNFMDSVIEACREASFLDGFICFENFEKLSEDSAEKEHCLEYILETASKFTEGIFVFSSEDDKSPTFLRDNYSMTICLDELSHEESYKIWNAELKGLKLAKDVDIDEIANKFTLNPLQIKRAAIEAELKRAWNEKEVITSEDLSDAAYTQITQKLSKQATLIKKKHTWDELVLPEAQKNALERACNQIRYKHVVYDEWNLKNTILYGTGLSMLFTGPPGTGKTMAAQVIANELHLEIYRVDLSQVVSKYIGETEKNLSEIFDSAKKSNVILLFDETDALFGKRTEVKDSHDKHANLETAYLLQKMEEYNGITIMTTNLIENLDPAFFRRLSYVIHFPLPDEKSRKMIWKKIFPKTAPIGKDVDFDFLAKKFEISGGNIKNVVITSTFMAASEGKEIKMKHIIKALEYEMKKQGKMVSKSDFGEYAYLL